jgi:hypothetical protein
VRKKDDGRAEAALIAHYGLRGWRRRWRRDIPPDSPPKGPPPAPPFKPGGAPILQWIKIEDLVVDDDYQRPIYGAGHTNVPAHRRALQLVEIRPADRRACRGR